MRAVKVRIRGRVQGVGFRWTARAKARELGLVGWVRNTASGDVEALLIGNAEAVDQMLAWCGQGPSAARVDSVEHEEADLKGLDKPAGFDI